MLFKFRCNATLPMQDHVEAHFDIPGTRPIILRIPKPGPVVGELYDIDINGNGVPATAAASPAPAPTAPTRVGPLEPNNDMVICPHCTSQFSAIPVTAQVSIREQAVHIRGQAVLLESAHAEIDKLDAAMKAAQAERDAARAEVDQVRALLAAPASQQPAS